MIIECIHGGAQVHWPGIYGWAIKTGTLGKKSVERRTSCRWRGRQMRYSARKGISGGAWHRFRASLSCFPLSRLPDGGLFRRLFDQVRQRARLAPLIDGYIKTQGLPKTMSARNSQLSELAAQTF